MHADDWPCVQAIYAEGIAARVATFETEPPDYDAFDASHHAEHRFVAVDGGRVVGWVALAPTSRRACYAGVAENSIYVSESGRGRGVGRALMARARRHAEETGGCRLTLETARDNHVAKSLYLSLGYVRDHVEHYTLELG